jgi:short-subunit dehydrogenase
MATAARPLAIVTGASAGIGLELARIAAQQFDLVVVADEPRIEEAAASIRTPERQVMAVQADLATTEGVDKLYDAVAGRPVEALFANAGRGLGRAFVDQDWNEIRRVIDTNVTGTVYLVQKFARDMKQRGRGKILFTGSIAGFLPGTFQAVYNGTKAFVDSFSIALRHELEGTGVTVTLLMPGATDTEFFDTADMKDTKVGTMKKDDPKDVAKTGFDAMMKGEESVVHGLHNKMQVTAGRVLPKGVTAEMHRKLAEPGGAKK